MLSVRTLLTTILACSIGASVALAAPIDRHGALTVSGGKVVDKNGLPPQLRGMSFYWSQAKVGKDFYNAKVVDWMASDWNVSILRAAMAVEGDWSTAEKGYLSDPTGNKARVKAVVDQAIAKGVYVIIDWHDHNALDHKAKAVEFFTEMSKTYGKSPNVIFEIFNEPLDVPWSSLKTYATDLLAAIRTNSDNLVIVGTGKYDTELIPPSKDPITTYKNVAYAFHMYASEEWHHTHYMKRADSAIAAGLPLFVSEWGLTLASGNGTLNMSWIEEFWGWMEANKLSNCAWSISDAAESSASLKAVTWNGDGSAKHNVSVDGGWAESDLTEGGKWLRNKFRSLNQTSVLTRSENRCICLRGPDGRAMLKFGSAVGPGTLQVVDAKGQVKKTISVNASRSIPLDLERGLHFVRMDNQPAVPVMVP
jgi:endoglucanase